MKEIIWSKQSLINVLISSSGYEHEINASNIKKKTKKANVAHHNKKTFISKLHTNLTLFLYKNIFRSSVCLQWAPLRVKPHRLTSLHQNGGQSSDRRPHMKHTEREGFQLTLCKHADQLKDFWCKRSQHLQLHNLIKL